MTDETHGPVEIRASGAVRGVDFPERIIELVVIPYEEATEVLHRGQPIREVVSRGAFDGIERRSNRVRVNYQHQDDELSHLLGRAVSFHPDREDGLVARVRIRRGPVGDDALTAADDGDLGASAGFGVMKGGETWPERGLRRLTRLFLDHIALTPTPAYPGARILSVRASDDPPAAGTPNLDEVRAWRLEDRVRLDPLYR